MEGFTPLKEGFKGNLGFLYYRRKDLKETLVSFT
jgi:hypothetical protein